MIESATYALQIADSHDVEAVLAYYRRTDRPATVFERTQQVIEKTISQGLFLLLKNAESEIVAAAAVYTLEGSMPIGKKQKTRIVFAEIGSLWRRSAEPKGFIRELFYSAAILQTLYQANDKHISALATQVVSRDRKGAQNLGALNLGWQIFEPSQHFSDVFKKSIVDENSKRIKLRSYITAVNPAAIEAANCLLGLENSKLRPSQELPGYLVTRDFLTQREIMIDLTNTSILQTAQKVHAAKKAGNDFVYNSWAQASQEILAHSPQQNPIPGGSFAAKPASNLLLTHHR